MITIIIIETQPLVMVWMCPDEGDVVTAVDFFATMYNYSVELIKNCRLSTLGEF